MLTTFSIAARCARTGMLGVAVSTRLPAVGALSPYVRAAAGAVASQALVNPFIGLRALELLAEGASAEDALRRLIDGDAGRELRQVGVVDARGGAAAHSGTKCEPWSGHRLGEGYAVAGNFLAGGEVVEAMAAAFEDADAEALPERLMRALEAGQRAGGDRRGKQSAALKVAWREEYPYVDLRVDDHPEPVAELRRLLELFTTQLQPFLEVLPTAANPAGVTDLAEIRAMAQRRQQGRAPQPGGERHG